MSNSIDLAAICLGAALGYGLRKEIKSTGEVCRNALLAAVAGAAATAAKETEKSPEAQAAEASNGNGKNG